MKLMKSFVFDKIYGLRFRILKIYFYPNIAFILKS